MPLEQPNTDADDAAADWAQALEEQNVAESRAEPAILSRIRRDRP